MHPVLIALPTLGLAIRAYDVLMVLAVLAGLVLAPYWGWRFEGLDWRRTLPASLVVGLAIFVGARIHFVATNWTRYAGDPLAALRFWAGGLHAPGGLVALVLAAPFVLRAFKVPALKFADICTPTGGVILAIVRLGCFLNGCCFGSLCAWPWGVRFPRQSYVFLIHADQHLVEPTAVTSAPVHPLQLYFLAASVGIALFGTWLERHKRFDGECALAGVFLYSATSGALEFFRGDYPERVFWGPLPQLAWVTLTMAAVSAIAWGFAEYQHRAHAREFTREAASAPRDAKSPEANALATT